MIAVVRCGKCGGAGKFDIGDITTIEDAQAKIDSAALTSCPFGNHVELSPIAYVVLDIEEGRALTDEEWLARMRVDRDMWTTEQLRRSEIRIEGFAFGFPIATVRGTDFPLDAVTSPEGHRYYGASRGAYARAVANETNSDDD